MAESPRPPRAGLGTRAVHLGRSGPALGPRGETAHSPALFQTSNFTYPDAASADAAADGGAYIYSRQGNPTTDAFASTIADLENAEAGLAFASGMAAVAAAVFAHAAGGEVLASEGLYGGSIRLLSELGPRHGIAARLIPTWDPTEVARAIQPQTRVLLVETISNPLLRVADLARLAAVTRKHGVALIVDSTFSSPALCRPLDHGATLVLHSVSKYIGGHGDVIGGVVAGAREAIDRLRPYLILLGGSMDPFAAWLALRGLRTLTIRLERSSATAARLAEVLARTPTVKRVHYPGLSAHPDHALVGKVVDSGGAMITIELADGVAARRVYDRFQVFSRAASLGEVSSLVTHPASFTHRDMSPADRNRAGIAEGLLRLSIGIEDYRDLEADLIQALRGASA